MTLQEALIFIDELLLEEKCLNNLQETIFRYSWEGKTYVEIAVISKYDTDYIKLTGFQLWQLLSKALGEKITKKNFRSILRKHLFRNKQPNNEQKTEKLQKQEKDAFSTKTEDLTTGVFTHVDFSEAVEVSSFYGREQELATLERWIVHEECRLITISGIAGIGKTSLTAKLGEKLCNSSMIVKQNQFDYVIWRSFQNAPPTPESLLNNLISLFIGQQKSDLQQSVSEKISQLLDYLQSYRCLIILDNIEAILASPETEQSKSNGYQDGYEAYEEIFKQVGELRHQSCLVLTSREKPKIIAILEGETLSIRSMQLSGLSFGHAKALLHSKGSFWGSTQDWQTLIQFYDGNPLALKIVGTTIQNLFNGDISKFLAQNITVFGDIEKLIMQQFALLSDTEKKILYWLVINQESRSFSKLKLDMLNIVPPAQLLAKLEALERKSLFKKNDLFTIQPVLMNYITSLLDLSEK
jgi:hypothetical protein